MRAKWIGGLGPLMPDRFSLRRYGLVLTILLAFALLAIAKPQVLHPRFVVILLRQVSINGILAVGVTFVLLTGGVDLSLGSLVALTGVMAAHFAHPNDHFLLVPIGMGILVGLCCGSVNGLLVSKGRVAPFVVTLGMMTAARGLASIASGGIPVSDLSVEFKAIATGSFLGVPTPVLIWGALAALSAFTLSRMRIGRYLYATGGNTEAARASGISVDGVRIFAYTVCGALAGIAGVVQAARSTTGQPSAGVMYELDAIAAVVIGGTSLSGGVGGIGGTILGAILIGIIATGLDMVNVPPYYQWVIKGVIIVGAVWLDKRGER